MVVHRKYLPLLRMLATLAAPTVTVWVTFTELEALIGALAPSGYTSRYWTNSGTARQNWQSEGFDARLDRIERAVVFTRRQP